MNKIAAAEEKRLVNAVERVIKMTNDGADPNDALQKVAEEEQYPPPFVQKMAEAFNVSSARAHATHPDEAVRTANYKVADGALVCSRMFTPKEAEEKEPVSLPVIPRRNTSDKLLQKAAECNIARLDTYHRMDSAAMFDMIASCRGAHRLLMEKAAQETHNMRENIRNMISKLGEHMARMSPDSRTKFCRLVVNGYNETGEQLLKQAAAAMNVKLEGPLNKTADSAVFPVEAPYILVADIHNEIERCLKQGQRAVAIQKYAETVIDDLVEGMSDAASGVGSLLGAKKGDKDKLEANSMDDAVDPEYFNGLREVDTRRTFANLMLYDPELKNYEIGPLIRAYNNAVQRVPEAVERPPTLKALMLQDLNSGGITDMFQESQAAQLSKSLRERMESAQKAVNDKKMLKLKKEEVTARKAPKGGSRGEPKQSLVGALLQGGKSDKGGAKAPAAAESTSSPFQGKRDFITVRHELDSQFPKERFDEANIQALWDRYMTEGYENLSDEDKLKIDTISSVAT